ncbi:glutamate-rich protein 5 isoform X1 [Malaclemys terrapin pileata]|uniref:glutamate-rich protein 5 isoform X1 n=2 Tax=Malaclemys terrapin pileata TaxID=2991368 RepID=UPI0023A8A4CE|nr:glutamate-rich protein 5 isoform X1 [Malaclemys terrapin pileata]
MGCSSSAQTQTQDSSRPAAKPSDTNGLQKCATSDENFPTTEENETIPDQTKLDPMEEVDLTPGETKPSENLPAEEPEVLIPAPAECVNSNYKRVDLEGTQPPPAGPAEGTGIPPPAGPTEGPGIPLPAGPTEGTGILPPARPAEGPGIPPPAGPTEGPGIPPPAGPTEGPGIPPPAGPTEGPGIPPPAGPTEGPGIPPPAGPTEGTGIPPPAGPTEGPGIPPPAGPAEGTGILPPARPAEGTGIPPPAGPAEGSVSPVTEIVRKVQSNEEDQLIEGNICAFADSGGQILPSETCVQVLLTSVNVAHECVRAEFSPQSSDTVLYERMWLGKPHAQKSKL